MEKFNLIDGELMNGGTCLYNSSPIPLNPELAFLLGDADLAVVLQQVHYWLQINKQNMARGISSVNVIKDNRVWCFQTYEEWETQFIWMDIRTIKRKIEKLENLGLIISGDFNAMRKDRTKWYTINYKELSKLTKEFKLKMDEKIKTIESRKEKQKEYNRIQNSTKKAKCQSVTMPKCQSVTMPKCQSVTSNNNRLTGQENNPQENNQSVNPSVKSYITETDRLKDEIAAAKNILQDKINIEDLKQVYPLNREIIEEIELNILEMYTQKELKIKDDIKPKDIVQSVLNKLTYSHIENIINKFNKETVNKKIKNVKSYLQTMIYNEPFEMSSQIKGDVNYHLAHFNAE